MRRFVVICMMMLLPFQWTWAAAGAYCPHEVGTATRHFGHHAHTHKKAPTNESSKTGGLAKLGEMDPDCDYCHLGAAQGLPVLLDFSPVLTGTPCPLMDPLIIGSHIGSGPERPDRRLAV